MHEHRAKDDPAFDHDRLCSALRTLGIFYGSNGLPASVLAGGMDEDAAIRAYIQSERPHLLTSYDMESLVALVRSAMDAGNAPSSLEQYAPA